jgi:hypothetical protein
MKQNPHTTIQQSIGKRHACYILITCDKPAADGKMQVEMTYKGDIALASYLLEGAQSYIDQESAVADSVELNVLK